MKKHFSILAFVFLLCLNLSSFGQTYLMPATGTGTSISTCSGTFYDNAGTSNYSNNCNGIQTFCSTSGKIQFVFSAFVTRDANDYLKIYDGPTTASTLIGTYSGTTSPGTILSTGTCITFEFVSNGSGVKAGWIAAISCPIQNNDCSGATPLISNPACSYTSGSTVGGTNSSTTPGPGCAGFVAGTSVDVWYTFVGTGTTQTISTQAGSITDGGMAIYSGTCGALTLITCNDDGGPGLMPEITGTYTSGVTYYIRVWAYSTTVTGTFDICVTNPSALTCPAGLGTGAFSITLPVGGYSSGAQTTCGMVNNLTSTNVTTCGSTSYYTGEDVVYYFTAPATGQSTITLTSTGSWTGIMLYAGCPFSGGTCVAQSQSSTGNKSMCVTLTSGVTYYLVIDSYASPTCNPYSLTITYPAGIPAGTTCSNAVTIVSLPYSATGESTACMGNDYSNSSIGSCNTSYESGEDKVYQYTTTGSACIGITLSSTSTSSIGFQVYSGCPGTVGTTCVGSAGGATSGTLTGSVVLPAAGTYYIMVDTWSAPANATYNISLTNYGSGAVNDDPCNAILMTLGSSETGDNNCSGFANEPATTPSCWTAGYKNTVWYKVVAPASGSLKIKTFLNSLTNTQIAVYSGTCGTGLTMVTSGCNDNSPSCGGLTSLFSELTVTGLTSGTTYYIAVDGANDLVGTFSIVAIDGSTSFPPIAGMDCSAPNPVCASSFSVADPGYSGYGNTCDLPYPAPVGNCLSSAERNIVWYTIPINNGTPDLVFDIVPNDFNPATETETDYDFGVWKIGGSGAVTCAQIAAGTALPLRCNYSGLGVTGLNGPTDAPNSLSAAACPTCGAYNPDPSYDGAYDDAINVANGDVYLLGVSNFSSSTSGFRIDFLTSPIGYTGSTATSVTWTGGTSTSPALASNWGGCNIPSCSIDAVIAPFTVQPVITTSQSMKNVTIQPGATLTINAGVTLTICGDFTNNGSLVMSPTATLLFNNTVTHVVSGNLTGTNAVGNITVNQTAGGVSLLNNIDIAGNFTTSSNTSIFNTNGNYVKVAGNFVNATGNTTFSNIGTTGTLEFNGATAQTYNQGSSQLDLNYVLMNHSSTGVTLQTDMNIKSTTGTLTLTAGKINTTASFKVVVNNSTPASVSTGNTSSYVNGFLRRYINNSTGSFDFPVGTSSAYQRANVNFTVAPTITYLTADFLIYGSLPAALGSTECGATYNTNALDNGYWNIEANTANNNTGTYNMTLYNTNYTNAASGWTVMSRHNGSATWDIINGDGSAGTCVVSPVTAVVRNNMKGFSLFGNAQSTTPLPIELLSFSGKNEGTKNKLEWSTASEINNDYFTIERSSDGIVFEFMESRDGAGNSTQIIEYYTHDLYPFVGQTYYRLKQTDYDGEFSYSSIISIDNKLDEISVSNVFPNPTTADLNFDFSSPVQGTVSIQIMDCIGRIVSDKTINVGEGKTSIVAEMNELAKGAYTLKIEFSEGDFKSITKIMKY